LLNRSIFDNTLFCLCHQPATYTLCPKTILIWHAITLTYISQLW